VFKKVSPFLIIVPVTGARAKALEIMSVCDCVTGASLEINPELGLSLTTAPFDVSVIADTGHRKTQSPHEIHAAELTWGAPDESGWVMAFAGQTSGFVSPGNLERDL
jgi:hypothetical protein